MKHFYLYILFYFSISALAQKTGINTTTPRALLEIKSSNEAAPANTDGLLIPKINLFPSVNPTADQQGMMVYLKNASGLKLPGFYYWNFGTFEWVPMTNKNTVWGLNGNFGTNPTTNFIGTTDNVDVVFKRNNIKAGVLSSDRTAFGLNALRFNTTGFDNSAFGNDALLSNTTGKGNTANGSYALFLNTTGDGNTAMGRVALSKNTTGLGNTANGYEALEANTTGNFNTASGTEALMSNTTGGNNTANGAGALMLNTTGINNTAIGSSALFHTTTGDANTGIGGSALNSNSTGRFNTALGYFSNVAAGDLLNATTIGARAMVGASNSLVLGSISGVNGATSGVNVGIGTSIPLDKLHIVGNMRMVDGNQAVGKVLVSDANGTGSWQTNSATNAWGVAGNASTNPTTNFIGTTDNNSFAFKTNNIERVRISATGNLGVGSSAPIRLLHLENNSTSTTAGQLYLNQSGSGDALMHIGTTGGRHYNLGLDASADSFKIGTSNSLATTVTTGTLMTLLPTGEIGIGTTSPTRNLHISTNSTSTTNGQLYLEQVGTGDAFLHIGTTSGRHYNLGLDTSADSFKIGTSSSTATTVAAGTLMTLLPTGEVGIGTTTPQEKLHVSGPAGLTTIRIANTSTGGSTSNVSLDFLRQGNENTDWRVYNIGPNLTIGNSGNDFATVNDLYQFQGTRFTPINDNAQNLGQSTVRWNTLFATNGTINTSDAREKKNIQNLNYGLNELMQLRTVRFEWKKDDGSGSKLGLIAQELQKIIPEVVRDWDWEEDQQGNRKKVKAPILGVYYSDLIPVLIKSIQELSTENIKLTSDYEALVKRLESLEEKMR